MIKEQAFEKMIDTGNEYTLYAIIDMLGGFIWRMNHDMAKPGRIPVESHEAISKDVMAAQKQIEAAVAKTTRFGVEAPFDENKAATEEYWKWFRWWDSWKKAMTDDEWNEFERSLGEGGFMTEEQLVKYRPPGDWRGEQGSHI